MNRIFLHLVLMRPIMWPAIADAGLCGVKFGAYVVTKAILRLTSHRLTIYFRCWLLIGYTAAGWF